MFKRLGLILALSALLLAGCRMVSPPVGLSLGGSGNLATRDYTVTGFSALEVQNAFQATVTQGENYKIAITTDDNLLDVIVVEKVGERLVIRFDRSRYVSFRSTQQKAVIIMPALDSVTLSGASTMNVSGFNSEQPFAASLSGASRLTGSVNASKVRLDVSGASQASLNGATSELVAQASGASRFELSDLRTQTVSVDLSGASSASVSASDSLGYSLSGASTLRYSGKPTIQRSLTSGASSAVSVP